MLALAFDAFCLLRFRGCVFFPLTILSFMSAYKDLHFCTTYPRHDPEQILLAGSAW